MEEKMRFKNGLQSMRQLAAAKGNHITIGEILQCFPGMELDKEQIALIYSYAEDEDIIIDDYELHDTRSITAGEKELTGEEKEYFRMYLEDLEAIEPCEEDEMDMLIERLMNGEDYVINRLTEGNLHMVLETAQEYAGQGILIGDLVQEGNMALFLALQDLGSGEAETGGDVMGYLETCVQKAMSALLEELKGYKKTATNLASESNRLMAATMDLEEELGREATMEELSAKVGLPADKIRELIQVSMNAAEFANRDEEAAQEEAQADVPCEDEEDWN